MHLLMPDELVPMGAARRGLELDDFARQFMLYGHVYPKTRASLLPSLDEMYMSDDDLSEEDTLVSPINRGCGNVPFEPRMWQPKHARKARWEVLTQEEKKMIYAEETREIDREHDMDFGELERHEALNKRHPEILAVVERLAEEHTLKTILEEQRENQEPELESYGDGPEWNAEGKEFWPSPGKPPMPTIAQAYPLLKCPSTLDEELLMQADDEDDEEDLDYDWE
ncbi:hypothetical protein B0T14DRAFT_492903 [Immersiella caudata]|uniref:Uncharacterized protein n=1 Tax=Immersiella caudata TaxID=314043 RepID=A0AA39X3K1_9PEZI|nr:hypothetical protein B0T14DRAFT_492903 [Immersiella caudata]